MKDLPKMYHNQIDKDIKNNNYVFSTMDSGEKDYSQGRKDTNFSQVNNDRNYTVEQKIYNIFNSPNYIYKIDVIIVTDKDSSKKRIVGKTKTNLITIDGEYIPINTIRDIYIP